MSYEPKEIQHYAINLDLSGVPQYISYHELITITFVVTNRDWVEMEISAVCVFSMKDDIQYLFETGRFFKEESISMKTDDE